MIGALGQANDAPVASATWSPDAGVEDMIVMPLLRFRHKAGARTLMTEVEVSTQ